MYFPLSWPKQLRVQHDHTTLSHLSASYDHFLFAVLTQSTISIWFCKPSVEITSLWRSQSSLAEFGVNQLARWKPDNSKLAVTTSHGYIIFYQVDIDKNVRTQTLYNKKEERATGHPDALDSQYVECIPALTLSQLFYIQIPGTVMSLVCLRDELLVSTGRGLLQRIRWSDGLLNSEMTIEIASVPFSADLQHSRSSQLNTASIYVRALHYSSLLGGFAVVLSNGRAAFITANSLKFEPSQVVGVWAQEMTHATAVAVNHKYALITFGSANGEGTAYHLDEMTGALVVSHTLVISSKDFPDASQICGAVSQMRWTPEGVALAMSWERGGFSVWSVFGSLLHHSMGAEAGVSISNDSSRLPLTRILSMEWGSEGYHLWMISKNTSSIGDTENTRASEPEPLPDGQDGDDTCVNEQRRPPRLLLLQFVKSVLSMNPCMNILASIEWLPPLAQRASRPSTSGWRAVACQPSSSSHSSTVRPSTSESHDSPVDGMTNYTHLLLQGEDRLYLNPEESLLNVSSAAYQQSAFMSSSAFIGNKQWHVMHLPHAYLAHNWPIRFASMNASGQCVAVAGKCGLAHCVLYARKWKLFGNETQEKDMVVTGGLTWWKDFICVACYNIPDQRDEIRLYPRDCKLDNTFASSAKVPSQILLLNTFSNLVIVLCADSHIVIYSIEQKNVQQALTVCLSKIQEIAINNFIPHPANVVAISLTSLRTDAASTKAPAQVRLEAESILINVAGRLLMFQRDRSSSLGRQTDSNDRRMTFTAPVIVASSVENLWLYGRKSHAKPHLTEALWLGCGAAGMKVWLPLQPKEDAGKSKGFLSKRIMLPFTVEIYPLAMLFEAGIILGANSEAVMYPVLGSSTSDVRWPYLQLERTSQVYLHHILRQLLRRNLGVHALEVARTCTDLPYFLHVLELLVHEVLEEEATSKEPIPDALLPRVVAFVEEFPEYLQTIAHCARKSDVAVWEYFFSVVGNPIDLFQECLSSNKLDTAASYLIILQNLEKMSMARQHATMLLDAALEQCSWDLARDLVRFLSAIDSSEEESSSGSSRRQRQASTSVYPVHYPTPPVSPEDSDPFRFHTPAAAAVRARSVGKDEPTKDPVAKIKDKANIYIRGDSLPSSKGRHMSGSAGKEGATSSPTTENSERICVEAILHRHAKKLLGAYRMYDMAYFAANLDDYQFVAWLRKERLMSARIDDFVCALKQLHIDFQWPYPILSLSALKRISSVASIESQSNLSDPLVSAAGVQLCKMELSGGPGTSTPISDQSSFNADLSLQVLDENTNGMGAADPSEDSSSVMGGEADSVDSSGWSDVVGLTDLEQISWELANRGPLQSDVKLRFLFQLLVEAGCFEWAILVAIILRDSVLFLRVINASCSSDSHGEVARLLKGLAAIELWCTVDCPGYRPFLQVVQGHVVLLQQYLTTTQPNQPVTRHPSLGKCHVGSLSEGVANAVVGQSADNVSNALGSRENCSESEDEPDSKPAVDTIVKLDNDSRCVVS